MASQEDNENQHFFYEDEVYRISQSGRVCFGMVMENYEANLSDQDSDSENNSAYAPIKKGELRVSWHPAGNEEIVKDDSVGLADRSLMPGDVVRRMIKGKDTQRGYCRDVKVKTAIQVCGSPYVITNVSSERLKTIEEFASDLAVCLDSWVGSTRSVNNHMILTSLDGSKLQWNDLYSSPFEEYNTFKYRDTDASKLYYPGQIVISSLKALDMAEWINCTKEMAALRKKKHKLQKFIIQSIDTDSVTVRWQCKALSFENEGGHEGAHTQPKPVVEGNDLKRLKMLNLFEPCTVSIGDRYYLELTDEDEIINIVEWRKLQNREYKDLRKTKKSVDGEKLVKKSTLNFDLRTSTPKESMNKFSTPSETALAFESAIRDDKVVQNKEQSINNDKVDLMDCDKTQEADGEADWLSDSSCDTIASHSSSQSSSESIKRIKKSKVLSTKLLKGKKLRRTRRKTPVPKPPKAGDKVVIEIISTRSKANVVWQDGSIENEISSVNLYPIHHLDDQEFFPGDFVIAGAEGPEPPCLREYGVVQNMDHQGRTALVKWFRTYTSTQEPMPAFLSESEVSVYDLKDHPDFQYRPATIVIRVANFVGEDANCTAGQVIDNFPEGKVKVWWVDGHSSMCWPQDIFKIGEYDSDDGDFWADNASDDSWETLSGESITMSGSSSGEPAQLAWPELKPRLSANVERARTAMARLEEIFTQNPSLQSQEVMKKLLDVYKECRYLDRLMDTSFFHEDNFEGLIERVREKGTPNAAKQIKDHMSRLFSNDFPDNSHGDLNISNISHEEVLIESTDLDTASPYGSRNESKYRLESKSSSKTSLKDDWLKRRSPKSIVRTSSNPDIAQKFAKASIESLTKYETYRVGSRCEIIPPVPNNSLNNVKIEDNDSVRSSLDTVKMVIEKMQTEQEQEESEFNLRKNEELPGAMKKHSSTVIDGTVILHSTSPNAMDVSQGKTEDSGLFSHSARQSMGSSESYQSSTEYLVSDIVGGLTNQVLDVVENQLDDRKKLEEVCNTNTPSRNQSQKEYISILVCAKLCSLIKAQLVAAHAEIIRRYGLPTPSLTDIVTEENIEEEDPEELAKALGQESPATPMSPVSVSDLTVGSILEDTTDQFVICDTAPSSHNFYLTMLQPANPQEFFRTVRRELKLLRNGLPPGVWVKNYEDRMDLFSVLIRGPNNTPYEDGLFLFDFQLPAEYPRTPPLCHYISYCSDRLNPNLYEDGKVCVSLLGTWTGKGTEVWGPSSTLLQVFVSIQGLILVPEPYFNEAGYDRQKGSQAGCENSRMYNEMVVLKLVQATTKLIRSPPETFREEIMKHFKAKASGLLKRLENWLALSEAHNAKYPTSPMTPSTYRMKAVEQDSSILELVPPDFPLIPASKGFCLSLRSALDAFRDILTGLT